MKHIVSTVAMLTLIVLSSCNLALGQSNLDGNSYEIELKNESGKKMASWKKDVFVFASGKLYAIKMRDKEGFGSESYSPIGSIESDKGMEFSYISYNKYGSKLMIDGTAKGEEVTGIAFWTNIKGTHEFKFTGTLK